MFVRNWALHQSQN